MATKGIPPFKEIISHGFVLDSEGKAMSKSIGNTIAPQNIIQQIGVDVLRLFISSTDYSEDVRIGDEILKRVTESYRRIRNTFRFMLANLSDFDPAVDRVAFEDMERLDRYALHKLEDLVANVIPAYDAYEFHKVYRLVYSFCSQELSSLYLDILKDRLYASAPKSALRRSAQTVLYEVTSVLARLIAPIIPHTAEEVWQYIPGEKAESVLLAHFPFVRPDYTDKGTAERGDKILEVREQVLLALEEARQSGKIGKPMESRVVLHVPATEFEFLKEFEELLPSVFIVSQVELVDAGDDPLSVEVVAPNGVKCERCWLILESVGSHEDHPGLCDRCYEVVKDIAE
jgi:isoleucyl-tRNA synthetase